MTKVPPTATEQAPGARDEPPSAPSGGGGPVTAEAGVVAEGNGTDGAPAQTAPAEAPEPVRSPGDAPAVRVHEDRLDRRVAPMELSPTEALRLASDGPAGLSRRELPPDTSGGSGHDAS